MDPLSITLSAITLVQVASSVYNMAVSYGKSVAGLPGEVQSLISEIKLLEEVLQNLHDTFQEDSENPGNSTGTKKNDFLKPSMDECKEQLEILYSYLEKGKSKRRRLKNFGRRLKWPMKVQDTTEWILRMERFKGTFSLALQTESLGVQQKTHGEVEEIRLAQERDRIEEKRRKQTQQYRDALAWLSRADPKENHFAAQKLRHKGTGKWFTESAEFNNWKAAEKSFLWLYGNAGSGKTILSSTIIDSLIEGEKIHTVYFYCDYRDIERMSTVGLYASLTAQILQNNFAGKLPERFSKYFEDNKAKLPQEVALYTELMVLIESIGRTRVVVDALDECTTEVRQDILKTLFEMQKRGKINVLVTSREENDIKYVVESFGVPNVSLQIKPSATSNDLAMFVKGEIERTDTKLSRLRESTKQEILTAITAEAKGMFRWAKCTLDYIAGLRSDKAIKKSLTELPPGLNDVYDRILEKISHADKGIAMRVFHWLTCAYRPLLIQEMVEGLGIEWGSTRLDPDSLLNNPEDLLEICGSLVEINRDTGTISLAHFTVKEYLTSHLRNGKHADYFVDVMRANFRLAKLCVTYLSFEAFGDGPCQSMREYAQRCKTNTLFRYAATFWPKHARDHENTEDRSFLSVLEYFFLDPKMHGNFESWMQAYEEAPPGREFDTYLYRDWGIENRLIYAARLGLYSTVQLLLSKGYDPSAICKPSGRTTTPSMFQEHCGNPLNAACESGNVKVMELLLSKGVDINAMAGSHGLALNAVVHSDVQRNDFTALRYLLQRGANPNLTFGEENFPLYAAAFECSSAEAVKILIEGGADLTMADKVEATMFEVAGGFGMREIFEVIWEHGGGDYPNPAWDKIFNFTRGVDGWSLYLASQSNFFESAQKILLKNGHRIFKDPSYEKLMLFTFRWCSSKGYYKFLQQMLEYSGTEGEFFKLALLDAVRNGHAMTVSTILESHKGAIPGSPGSSLVLAGASGSLNVVKDLLQRGGDPTAVDEHGWSALLAATVFKQHDILELFDNMGKRLQDNTCTPLTPSSWQIERTLLPLWELPDPKLEISGNVVYLLPENDNNYVVYTNHPLLPSASYSYFEITILEVGAQSKIQLGLVSTLGKYEVHEPCIYGQGELRARAISYRDDGIIRGRKNTEQTGLPSFAAGSVIGCAVSYEKELAYFTCDGKLLDVPCGDVKGAMYAAMYLTPGTKVKANFGEEKFVFDTASLQGLGVQGKWKIQMRSEEEEKDWHDTLLIRPDTRYVG